MLRRARTLLIDQLGVDPGPALRALQDDILHHADTAEAGVGQVWAQTAAAYDRVVATSARARLESTVGLLRDLAVTGGGGLEAARGQRVAAIAAAEELGDPLLTARSNRAARADRAAPRRPGRPRRSPAASTTPRCWRSPSMGGSCSPSSVQASRRSATRSAPS